jgi:hypothetical protein
MVSLPAMGALSPRVEIRFCVGLILSGHVYHLLRGHHSLETVDADVGSRTANTAADVATNSLIVVSSRSQHYYTLRLTRILPRIPKSADSPPVLPPGERFRL